MPEMLDNLIKQSDMLIEQRSPRLIAQIAKNPAKC
jgi:hypothetical protein